ncbi:hypothetical protein CF319_g7218 [Tilletia indica]|nr:hypothetical protein CF319_g7218 [Tilletia indica]
MSTEAAALDINFGFDNTDIPFDFSAYLHSAGYDDTLGYVDDTTTAPLGLNYVPLARNTGTTGSLGDYVAPPPVLNYFQLPSTYDAPPPSQMPTSYQAPVPCPEPALSQNKHQPLSSQHQSLSSQITSSTSSSQVYPSSQVSSSSSASQRCLAGLREDLRKVYTIAYNHSKRCKARGERPDWEHIWRETRQYHTTEKQQEALKAHFDKYFTSVGRAQKRRRASARADPSPLVSASTSGSPPTVTPALQKTSTVPPTAVASVHHSHSSSSPIGSPQARSPLVQSSTSTTLTSSNRDSTPTPFDTVSGTGATAANRCPQASDTSIDGAQSLLAMSAGEGADRTIRANSESVLQPTVSVDAGAAADANALTRVSILPVHRSRPSPANGTSLLPTSHTPPQSNDHPTAGSMLPLQPSAKANVAVQPSTVDKNIPGIAIAVPSVTLSKAARTAIEQGSWKGWDYCGVFRWDNGTSDVLPLSGEELLIRSRDQPQRDSIQGNEGAKPRKAPRSAAFPGLRERWRCRKCGGMANEMIATTSNLGKHSRSAKCSSNGLVA